VRLGNLNVCARVAAGDICVEQGPKNSRRLFAGVSVAAPLPAVWAALTGYEHLGKFIPGLRVNKVLSRHCSGARVLQVGATELGLGLRFTARCELDIREWPGGYEGTSSDPFPLPRSALAARHCDISFRLLEGDFLDFYGLWRLQEAGDLATRLSYSLLVRPQPWLPVALIQAKVEREVVANLRAVARYVEANQAALMQQQRQRQAPG
jgi:hypothetical protein